MALHLISSEEVRSSCRNRLETCELWLRRLIDDEFRRAYGANYFDEAQINHQLIFNASMRAHMRERRQAEPGRYARPIDTMLLDQLTSVLCKPDVFKSHFRNAFSEAFPLGGEHLRAVMLRLIPIRNALSHANPLSITDAERALCYSSDIILAVRNHYEVRGMNHEFNAPLFTRVSDCFGNVAYLQDARSHISFRDRPLRCGDELRLEIEVDDRFLPDAYEVKWHVANIALPHDPVIGNVFCLHLLPCHVALNFEIFVTLTSGKEWHRLGNHDSTLVVQYTVLPPLAQ